MRCPGAQLDRKRTIHYAWPAQVGGVPGQQAVTALPTGPTVRPVNTADFRQHWDRGLVSTNVFRFQRQGFNACLRVPDNVAASQVAPIALASCSGTRAQWRWTSSPGIGDLYVNVATGHRMGPVFYVGDTVADKLTAYPGRSHEPAVPELDLRGPLARRGIQQILLYRARGVG